jgi:hypothetical protein
VLKQASAILLLIAFLVQSFSSSLIFLDYQLNKEYIAKNLCENKDKPAMKCEGHCYLCKRLKKEAKDQETPERRNDNRSEIVSFVPGFHTPAPVYSIVTSQYPHLHEALYNSFCSSFFHPPTC